MTCARAAAALAFAAALAACDDGGPPARGFGSRQIVVGRDEQLVFKAAWENLVFYSTGSGDAARYWSVDVETGDIVEHDAEYSDVTPPDELIDPDHRFRCFYRMSDGSQLLIVVDTPTAQETSIPGTVGPPSRCPSEDDRTLSVWRKDDAGRLALWTGPFDALEPAQLDVAIVPNRLLTLGPAVTYLIASAPGDSFDALGLYRVDLATFAVTVVIPATLADADAAWATGAAAGGPLVSSSVHHSGDYASILNWSSLGNRFFYERVMADGTVAMFVGPYDPPGPRELALFPVVREIGRDRIRMIASPASLPGAPKVAAWREYDELAVNHVLHVWQDELRQLATCPMEGEFELVAAATPDRRRVLISPRPADVENGILTSWGPALLVTPEAAAPDGSGACLALSTNDATMAGISPDGTALFWILKREVGDQWELWGAASDGSGQRLLGRDTIITPHFVGPSQLQFELRPDLVWLNVNDDPVRLHYIADDVFGDAIDLGRWLVTGYQRSSQDSNGRLGVVNRDTGETRLISPEVVKYITPDRNIYVYDTPPDRPLRVVYQVRGRNPSPQDGLWVATVDEAELP